jgi:tRNA nucleotidyltransferase (CCA-adding enzyme)
MEIITTHKNADFDAVASVFAAGMIYPQAAPVLPSSVNPNIRAFLSLHQDVFPFHPASFIDQEKTTRLILVDANRAERFEGLNGVLNRPGLDVHLWDHHGDHGTIRSTWSCIEPVGATATLLVRSLRERQRKLSPVEATLFLAGIYEDTGNLTFPSTTAEDARAVAFLLDQEADLNVLKTFLRPTYGPKQKDILFEMLKNAHRTKVNGYRVSVNKVDISGHTPGLAVVVEMYQEILNVDVAFGIFTEAQRDRSMVIGRSVVDGVNIASIMRSMGGGGHPGAGSALLKAVNPDAVESWLMELLKGNQQSSVQISDLMSYPVATVSPDTPLREAAILLREKGCTGLPVVEGEKLVGILSRKDFKRIRKSSGLKDPVKAVMSKKVIHIEPGSSVMEAARTMIKHDVGRLPVVEEGKLIGIVTRSDTMRYYYDLLPD